MSEKHIMLVVLAEDQSERLARCLKSIQHQEIPAEAKVSLIVAGSDTAVIDAALAEVDLTAQTVEGSSAGTSTQADLLASVAEQIPRQLTGYGHCPQTTGFTPKQLLLQRLKLPGAKMR